GLASARAPQPRRQLDVRALRRRIRRREEAREAPVAGEIPAQERGRIAARQRLLPRELRRRETAVHVREAAVRPADDLHQERGRRQGREERGRVPVGFRSKSTVVSAVPPATSTARRGRSPWKACPCALPATAASATTAVRLGSARLACTTAAPPRECPTSPACRPRTSGARARAGPLRSWKAPRRNARSRGGSPMMSPGGTPASQSARLMPGKSGAATRKPQLASGTLRYS